MSVLRAERGWESLLEGDVRRGARARGAARVLQEAALVCGQGARARVGPDRRGGASAGFPEGTLFFLVETRYRDGQTDTYFVPTRLAGGPEAERLTREAPGRIIARFNGPRGDRLLYDGMADPQVCQALLDAIAEERVDRGAIGRDPRDPDARSSARPAAHRARPWKSSAARASRATRP